MLFTSIFSCRNSLEENYNIGLESINNEDYNGAIDLFSKIIAKDSTIYEVYQSRSFCYFKSGEYKKAITDYQKAYSLNKNPQLNFNIGTVSYTRPEPTRPERIGGGGVGV